MFKILKRVLQVTFGLFTLPFVSILLQAIFNLNINTSLVNGYVTIALGTVLILILRSKTFYTVPLAVIWVFVVILCLKKNYEYRQITSIEAHWVQDRRELSIPFYRTPSGHIFIRVIIDGQNGYMGFDTGAEITGIRESNPKSLSKISMEVTDSQGNSNWMNLALLDSLSIGSMRISKMSYIPMPSAAWEKCGIFYSQDSIVGILGNNVINHFVWDFDMVNKNIKLSETARIINSGKSETINLSKTGKSSWQITLSIGGEKKEVKLDTGSDQCLTLQNTVNSSKTYLYTSNTPIETRGLFSYMDCAGNEQEADTTVRTHRKVFADIQFNNSTIRNVYVNDQQFSNLLGVPLIWEYERVIFDFPNHRMHLIKQNEVESPHGLTQKSLNQIRAMKRELISRQGYFENNNNDTLKISGILLSTHDTITYNLFGLTKIYGHLKNHNHLVIDSILNRSDNGVTIRMNEFIQLNYDFMNEL